MGRNIYSVTDITAYLKRLISQDFMCSSISIRGELSNVKYHSSGHIYFTLKDAGAALSCIMFASDRRGLTFRMEDGQKVVCSGSVSVYEQAGRYQLYVKNAEQVGNGELYARFEKIRDELAQMGMFDASYKQPVPRLVRRLGVITSPTGAARRDIEQIAHRRNPYVQIILYPALVQGEGAVDSVIRGIRALEKEQVDVMIVGRGGGSIEDLWAFNSPEIAQAVFDCPVPIISAVGHETDTTIIDFVSDLRAPTPSAAAELAVCDIFELMDQLDGYELALKRMMGHRIERSRMLVGRCKLELDGLSPVRVLENRRQSLAEYQNKLHRGMLYKKQEAGRSIKQMHASLSGSMVSALRDGRMELIRLSDKLENEQRLRLQKAGNDVALLASRLDGLSPLKRLAAGYAYVEGEDEKGRRSVREVRSGELLKVYMRDGHILARAEQVCPADSDNMK